jgi:hypothetical protein
MSTKDLLTYEKYTEHSYIVKGDREKYGEYIKKFGRWNDRLKKGEGWLVSNDNIDTVIQIINDLNNGLVPTIEKPSKKKNTEENKDVIKDPEENNQKEPEKKETKKGKALVKKEPVKKEPVKKETKKGKDTEKEYEKPVILSQTDDTSVNEHNASEHDNSITNNNDYKVDNVANEQKYNSANEQKYNDTSDDDSNANDTNDDSNTKDTTGDYDNHNDADEDDYKQSSPDKKYIRESELLKLKRSNYQIEEKLKENEQERVREQTREQTREHERQKQILRERENAEPMKNSSKQLE